MKAPSAIDRSFPSLDRLTVLRRKIVKSVPRLIAWSIEQVADHREGRRPRGKGSSARACAPLRNRTDIQHGEEGEDQGDHRVDVWTETHVADGLEEGMVFQSRHPAYLYYRKSSRGKCWRRTGTTKRVIARTLILVCMVFRDTS